MVSLDILILGTRLFFFNIVGSLLHCLLASVVSFKDLMSVWTLSSFTLMNISEVSAWLVCSWMPLKYSRLSLGLFLIYVLCHSIVFFILRSYICNFRKILMIIFSFMPSPLFFARPQVDRSWNFCFHPLCHLSLPTFSPSSRSSLKPLRTVPDLTV